MWVWLAVSRRSNGGLPEGRWDWQVCTLMDADFPWLGRACSGVSGPQSSSRGRQFWSAAPCMCSGSQGWERLARLLGDKEALPQGSRNWQDHLMMEADFLWPGRACSGVSGLQSSSKGQAVLGRCSVGVQHLPRVGAASQATGRQRGTSLGQPELAGLPRDGGRFPAAGRSLLECFAYVLF